jgi:hypothetical protein
VNANADPNSEYLSDGITESLINSLSQLPNLKVMSRDSAFRYKGKVVGIFCDCLLKVFVLDKLNELSKQKYVSAVFMAKIYSGLS